MLQDSHLDESLMMESLLVPARTAKGALKNDALRLENGRVRKKCRMCRTLFITDASRFFFSDRSSRSESARDECTAYLIILMAMCCPVLWSSARITWPKLPLPITSRISYLNADKLRVIYTRARRRRSRRSRDVKKGEKKSMFAITSPVYRRRVDRLRAEKIFVVDHFYLPFRDLSQFIARKTLNRNFSSRE